MSVQVNTYLILGAKVPYPTGKSDAEQDAMHAKYEKFYDSAFEPRERGLVVLFDGMNGEYVVAGQVYAVTVEGGHFEAPIEVAVPDERAVKSVERELKAHLGIEGQKIQFWLVSHHR